MVKEKSKECEVLLINMQDLVDQYTKKEIPEDYYIKELTEVINKLKKNHNSEMSFQEKSGLKFLEVSMNSVKGMLKMQNKLRKG